MFSRNFVAKVWESFEADYRGEVRLRSPTARYDTIAEPDNDTFCAKKLDFQLSKSSYPRVKDGKNLKSRVVKT